MHVVRMAVGGVVVSCALEYRRGAVYIEGKAMITWAVAWVYVTLVKHGAKDLNTLPLLVAIFFDAVIAIGIIQIWLKD